MSDDPFAELAAEQISNPVRSRLRAAKTRAARKAAKQQDDREIQTLLWKRWHDARLKALMRGRYRKPVAELSRFLERMTIDDGDRLIALVERGPWRAAGGDTKYLILGLIDARIVYLRQAEGMAPFSDSVPFIGEAPTVFEIIRSILT